MPGFGGELRSISLDMQATVGMRASCDGAAARCAVSSSGHPLACQVEPSLALTVAPVHVIGGVYTFEQQCVIHAFTGYSSSGFIPHNDRSDLTPSVFHERLAADRSNLPVYV